MWLTRFRFAATVVEAFQSGVARAAFPATVACPGGAAGEEDQEDGGECGGGTGHNDASFADGRGLGGKAVMGTRALNGSKSKPFEHRLLGNLGGSLLYVVLQF